MYAVVEAVAGQVAEGLGDPYTHFPFKLSTYGGGGVSAWGTLCGTCNGAAMALSFFRTGKKRSDLVSELLAWYEDTPLPVHAPAAPINVARGFEMPSSRPGSTLCHVSITRWVRTAGFESFSPGTAGAMRTRGGGCCRPRGRAIEPSGRRHRRPLDERAGQRMPRLPRQGNAGARRARGRKPHGVHDLPRAARDRNGDGHEALAQARSARSAAEESAPHVVYCGR